MADPVPRLTPRPLSRAVRLASLVHAGIRTTTAQIEPYTAWWDAQNQAAADGDGPLLVAVGDSTAIGIGASIPERSYVGRLHHRLRERDPAWRAVNLALSGARVADALDRQLPALAGLGADLVVCCIGTNDLVWGKETTALRDQLRRLVAELPDGAVVGRPAGGSPRARMASRALHNAGRERGLAVIDPWAEPTPEGQERLAVDRFHPNDLGYELMEIPYARALGLLP